jgi:hypothetical protein
MIDLVAASVEYNREIGEARVFGGLFGEIISTD